MLLLLTGIRISRVKTMLPSTRVYARKWQSVEEEEVEEEEGRWV
jgi:hypothetical protein